MRKTKKCCVVKLEGVRKIRTCMLARLHEGDHLDVHGRWKEDT